MTGLQCAVACAALLIAAGDPVSAGEAAKPTAWKYVAQPDGGPFARPVLTAVPLAEAKPEQMTERVAYRGSRRRYAQLRFGSEDSLRVIVVVDERDGGEFDLYLDRDRNRFIDKDDLVAGTGRMRTAPLKAHVPAGPESSRYLPRTVELRRGLTGASISVGTVGYVEGRAKLGGKTVTVRRVDGDANGLFSDAADRLWIDLDASGQWDAISEQFPYLPMLRLDAGRFAVRGDRTGERLVFEPIEGVGRVKLHLPTLAAGASAKQLEVMLFGEDGSAHTLRGDDKATELPMGRYSVGSVCLSLADGKKGEPWNFVFSRSGGERPERWHEVRREAELLLDPIGKFRFDLGLGDLGSVEPGSGLYLRLRLHTADDLLINSSSCGPFDRFAAEDRHNCARVQLLRPGGTVADSSESGFA